jgi:hypothetical protein
MPANTSVGHNENVNILALHVFTAAWKNLSVTTVSNSWRKAGILSVAEEIMEENFIDDGVKDNWQQICQKTN